MEQFTMITTIMQACLCFGNICIMLYALKKFLNAPHNTLANRLSVAEEDIKEIKARLLLGDKEFNSIDKSTEVLLTCMLALVDFEISYCLHTGYEHCEDLTKCKEKLHEYLAKS